MKDSYAELKTRYEAKAAQMHRLQVQNVSLLNMAASGNSKGDGDHIKRLEELLQVKKSLLYQTERDIRSSMIMNLHRLKGRKPRL